ncbi:MAG: glycosyltransferase [Elusimicrobiota bacterium]
MSEPELSVVIPTVNEAASIGGVVRGVRAEAGRLGAACEVIVVDGGSSDGTCREARAAGARAMEDCGGFAESLRRGIAAARGGFILVMDGDGSHPVETFSEMWRRRHEADVVVGSRLVPGGDLELPAHRRWLTRLLNGFFRLALRLPVADSSSGFRLYRAGALRGIEGSSAGFEFQQETLLEILRNGGSAVEVPIRYVWRAAGTSKARILALGFGYLRTAARFWWKSFRNMR